MRSLLMGLALFGLLGCKVVRDTPEEARLRQVADSMKNQPKVTKQARTAQLQVK